MVHTVVRKKVGETPDTSDERATNATYRRNVRKRRQKIKAQDVAHLSFIRKTDSFSLKFTYLLRVQWMFFCLQ